MKIKSLLCLFFTVVLALSLLPVSTMAAGDPKLTSDMPQTIQAGKQFVVTVGIENNPGWSAVQFEVTYDTQQLEFVSMKTGEAMEHPYFILCTYHENPTGTVNIIGLYNDDAPTVEESGNYEKDGDWFHLYFTAKSTLKAGDEVEIKADMTTMVNAKLEPVMDPTVINAMAKVGQLSAEDNKTQPTESKAVSGQIGTMPSATVGSATTAGDAEETVKKTVVTNVPVTEANGQTVTDANGDTVTTQTVIEVVTTPEKGLDTLDIVLIAAGGVLVIAAVVLVVVLSKKRR